MTILFIIHSHKDNPSSPGEEESNLHTHRELTTLWPVLGISVSCSCHLESTGNKFKSFFLFILFFHRCNVCRSLGRSSSETQDSWQTATATSWRWIWRWRDWRWPPSRMRKQYLNNLLMWNRWYSKFCCEEETFCKVAILIHFCNVRVSICKQNCYYITVKLVPEVQKMFTGLR